MTIALLSIVILLVAYQLYLQWDEYLDGEDVWDYLVLSGAQLFLLVYCLMSLRK